VEQFEWQKLLTRLVGTSRARELMFLSERIDARRCETLGLVNRVVPDAELRETAFALARSLAEGPSIALARMKDNLDHAVTSGLSGFNGSGSGKHGAVRTDDRPQGGGACLHRQTQTRLHRALLNWHLVAL
jgi:enoyl-CoA hydratase/carnithine racemase